MQVVPENSLNDDDEEVTNENMINFIVQLEKKIVKLRITDIDGKKGYLVNEKIKLGNDSGLCLMRQYIEF